MKHSWRQFLSPLTAGVRVLLSLLASAYLAALLGRFTRTFDLYAWLALSPPAFWDGHVWQAVTYALLPAGFFDFVLNGVMLAWLGVWLERVWSRHELWIYCLLSALGAGLAKVVLMPHDPFLMAGTTAMVFGLLAAWARLFGHERVDVMGVWPMSARQAALLFAVISLLGMLPCAGPVNALVMLCGGITGWIYLAIRLKFIRAQPSQVVPNERIGKLEL